MQYFNPQLVISSTSSPNRIICLTSRTYSEKIVSAKTSLLLERDGKTQTFDDKMTVRWSSDKSFHHGLMMKEGLDV
jgi:hypothetical protein